MGDGPRPDTNIQYRSPEDLILSRQAEFLRTFFKTVAALTFVALMLIVFLPGFATSEDVLEPFLRNVGVLIILGALYYALERGFVLATIFGTIGSSAAIASYTIFMESPGNMQMLALIILPTGIAGFLPRRSQFWIVFSLNFILALFTVWLIVSSRGVELEYQSVVTLMMLLTLFALLIDAMASSYRRSIRTTFNQLNEIGLAQEKLTQLDADLDAAVTERLKAESVSNQLAQTGRLALEAAGAGSITIDYASGDVEITEDFVERFSLASPVISLADLINAIHPDDRAEFESMVKKKALTKDRLDGDFRLNSHSPVYWMFMLEIKRNDENHPESLQGVIVDVTQRIIEQQRRYAMDSKARESQRLESLGVLAGAIAHDFNNLLHVIMLNADLARHNLNPDSKSATSIERLMLTVDRAAELCSELLAYSGRGQFTIEPFELEQLVSEMRSLLEISTPKGVEITCSSDDTHPVVEGDVTQIRQVVMNLITNAGEAIGNSPGSINVSVGTRECDADCLGQTGFVEEIRPGTYACITVEDTGQGMDAATTHRIFDPFFSTKETGHGLGLSAVLGIIRGHDGAISVRSERDAGTVVTILLPLSSNQETTPQTTEAAHTTEPTRGLILFADDETEIRHLARTVLEDSGYSLIEASDGQQAVDRFTKYHDQLQLVILDLMMPNKTGLEAYFEITELDPSVPVVFSSGFNENEALQQLPPKTRSGFLKKPYLADDLKQFVNEIIGPKQ